jgi:hypothetical protein
MMEGPLLSRHMAIADRLYILGYRILDGTKRVITEAKPES